MTDAPLQTAIAQWLDRIQAQIASRSEPQVRPPTPEDVAEQERYQREAAQAQWERERRKLGVPRLFWQADLDTAQSSPVIERVRQFLAEEAVKGQCLVLIGPTGVGKTYAAVAALLAWDRSTRRFFYFPALCGSLLDQTRREEALAMAKGTGFLVLDDFGVEYLKDGGLIEALTDEIIWHREAECLPTIITTNLLPEKMHGRVSDRILDRLRGWWGHAYVITGQSRRGV